MRTIWGIVFLFFSASKAAAQSYPPPAYSDALTPAHQTPQQLSSNSDLPVTVYPSPPPAAPSIAPVAPTEEKPGARPAFIMDIINF